MRRSASWQRLIIYGLSGPIIALNLWLLSLVYHSFEHLVTVLTVAAILAFLLNYPVRFFERAGITRAQAVIIVLLVSVMLLVLVGLTLVPLVIDQTNQLLLGIPVWLANIQERLGQLDKWGQARSFF